MSARLPTQYQPVCRRHGTRKFRYHGDVLCAACATLRTMRDALRWRTCEFFPEPPHPSWGAAQSRGTTSCCVPEGTPCGRVQAAPFRAAFDRAITRYGAGAPWWAHAKEIVEDATNVGANATLDTSDAPEASQRTGDGGSDPARSAAAEPHPGQASGEPALLEPTESTHAPRGDGGGGVAPHSSAETGAEGAVAAPAHPSVDDSRSRMSHRPREVTSPGDQGSTEPRSIEPVSSRRASRARGAQPDGDRPPGAGHEGSATRDGTTESGGVEADPRPLWSPRDGGVYVAWPRETEAERAPVTHRILRALERVVERTCGPAGAPSPRLHAGRIVRELVARRVSLVRCRREEHERRVVLITCDVSGSCSSSAPETVAAAWALARADARVIAVRHSNGCILDAVGTPVGGMRTVEPSEVVQTQPWLRLLDGATVPLVVAFGDCDAAWAYAAVLAHGATLLWLDSDLARHVAGPTERAPRFAFELPHGARMRYWCGVNSGLRGAEALEACGRSMCPFTKTFPHVARGAQPTR